MEGDKTMITPPDASRVIEGLRDTGYTFQTAISDIVDNSIDHGKAKNINVIIEMDYEGDIFVAIADDGCGMNEMGLVNAMTYGSMTLADPANLGKFGLGLKTASTAFCRKISLISRSNKKDPLKKFSWDLDHIKEVNDWDLLDNEEPDDKELDIFNNMTKKTGTLVVWRNVDRAIRLYDQPGGHYAQEALKRLIEKTKFHFGLTYQKYLDVSYKDMPQINLNINGGSISPWDPLCLEEDSTESLAKETKKVGTQDDGEILGKFSVHAVAIPDKFSYSSEVARKNAKISNDMQGFYVYRLGRLIHHGSWLGLYSREPHLSLCRVSLSFDHKLDEAFQIDIKKSRILLNESLIKYLKTFLTSPRRAADAISRKGSRLRSDQVGDAHKRSRKLISGKEKGVTKSSIDNVDVDGGKATITNPGGQSEIKIKIFDSRNPEDLFIKTVENLDDGLLWEPAITNTKKTVLLNIGHTFYNRVYLPNHKDGVVMQGIDSLLWALCDAELSSINESSLRYFKELRYEVSRILRQLIEELPETE